MTDNFNYKKEWEYQKKQADQWFEVYQRALDTMQELVNKLREYEKKEQGK
jgi:hypothetical protein